MFGHSFGALVALAYATARLDLPFMASPALPLFGDLMRHTVPPLIARALWPRMLMRLFSPAPVPRYFQLLPTWMAPRPSQLRAAAEDAAPLHRARAPHVDPRRVLHAIEVAAR